LATRSGHGLEGSAGLSHCLRCGAKQATEHE